MASVRQEAQNTGLAFTSIFSNDVINAASFRIGRAVIVGTINDLDELNSGLSITESLTRNLAAGFQDLGDIALLQLGQIAQFLGDDLFETPLAGLESAALQRVGLGQLEGGFQVVSAGTTAATAAGAALSAIESGFLDLTTTLTNFEGQALGVAKFFGDIALNAKFASSVLVTVADAIDDAIEQVIDAIAELNPVFKAARDGAKSLGLEFGLGRKLLGDYIDEVDRIEAAAKGVGGALEATAGGARQVREGVKQAGDQTAIFNRKLAQQRKAAEQAEQGMESLAQAAVLFDAYSQASEVFDGFFGSVEEIFNAAKEAEALSNRLQVTSQSAGGAAEDLDFLNQITNELGLNFNAAAKGYTQFSAATSQVGVDAAKTNEIFENVAESVTVMRLSAADAEGVFLALRQVISGDVVQLEELNQIAERVPGAFAAAEAALRSMGYEAGSVRDIVSTGTVDSKQFVETFAAQLASTTQSGVVGASQSAEAAVNRFTNSLGELQIAMGQGWLEFGVPALNAFADALSFAAKNEEIFATAIDALLVAAAARGAAATISFTKALFTGGAAIKLFGTQINLTAARLGAYAIQVGLAYAATILFYRNLDRAKDSAKNTRTAIASLEKSLADYRGTAGGAEEVQIFPEEPPPLDWLDGAIQGIVNLGEEGNFAQRGLGNLVEALTIGTASGINRAVNFFKTGSFEFVSAGEKAANDVLAAIGDFALRAQDIVGESIAFRAEFKGGDSALQEIQRIDSQLKRLENAKLSIDPGNEKELAAIAQQEEDLLTRRAEAQKKVTDLQTGLNNALEQAKQQLAALDPARLGQGNYENAKSQLESQIRLIETEKAKFDELAIAATDSAKEIADSFKQSNEDLEQEFVGRQAAIAEQLANGSLTEEEAQQQNLTAEREYLNEKIRLNTQKAAELRAELEKNSKLKAVDTGAAILTPEQEEQYTEQARQLELEAAQSRIQVAQGTRDEKDRILQDELNDLREANEKAEALIQRSESEKVAAIRRRQLDGAITEEQAQAEILKVRENAIAQEVDLIKAQIAEVAKLETQGRLDPKEAAQQERDLQQQLADLSLQLIEQQIQAQEELKRKRLEDIELAAQQAQAKIDSNVSRQTLGVKQSQLDGAISEQEAQAQILDIQREASRQQLALKEQQLAQVRQLQAQGLITEQEAQERSLQYSKEASGLRLQLIDQELEARRKLLDEIAQANREAEAAITQAQQSRLLAIKQQQVAGVAGERSAQEEILRSEQELTDQKIALAEQQLAEVASLRDRNLIGEEEAVNRQLELRSQLGDLQIQQADQELALQQQLLDARLSSLQAGAQAQQTAIELQDEALNNQQNLLSAQMGVLQARFGLEQLLLQGRLAEAEAAGSAVEADALRGRLAEAAQEQELRELEIKKQQLSLQIEQNNLQAQQVIINAEVARAEGEINLQKAIGNGASAQEIANLERILGLRERQLSQANSAYENQQKINGALAEQLRLEERTTREKQRQEDASRDRQRSASRATSESATGGGGAGTSGGAGLSLTFISGSKENIQFREARKALDQALKGVGDAQSNILGQLLGLQRGNPFFELLLKGTRFEGLGNLASQLREAGVDRSQIQAAAAQASLRGEDVIAAVQRLADNISRYRPNVSIRTENPVADYNQFAVNQSRSLLQGIGG